MRQTTRNIELAFNKTEIDIITEALTTVTGAPAVGVPALLRRFDEVSGENGAPSFTVSADELCVYQTTGKRSYKMRRYHNRQNYLKASGKPDKRAKEWASLFDGVEQK